MGKGHSMEGKDIALIVAFLSIFISKLINNPTKTAVIGGWLAVLGDTLSAIGDTEELLAERDEEKKKIKKEIDELQRRLETLNKC